MQGDVSVEPVEERDPVTNQDRKDGIANFVGKPKTKGFGSNDSAANNPDGTERRPKTPVHEMGEIP